jgi:hypothetical protein
MLNFILKMTNRICLKKRFISWLINLNWFNHIVNLLSRFRWEQTGWKVGTLQKFPKSTNQNVSTFVIFVYLFHQTKLSSKDILLSVIKGFQMGMKSTEMRIFLFLKLMELCNQFIVKICVLSAMPSLNIKIWRNQLKAFYSTFFSKLRMMAFILLATFLNQKQETSFKTIYLV